MRLKKMIPNMFTLGNLYCGFLSIGFAASGQFKNAAVLIIIGMMLDSMDGRLARMLNADSELGKELDSLADIVTFGVAPSFLVYYTSFYHYGLLGFIVAGLFPLFGGYRLARFNTSPKKASLHYFVGVPITAAGGIMAILTLFGSMIPNIVITVIFTAMCFLMVSRIRIPSLKEVPLPKYGTIVTIFLGAMLYVIYKGTYEQFPYLIYIATPLYIAYLAYKFVKR
ncbi:CDP-diacylglycerol--serine O-phosphatidyltransferase [Rossellomorea marisflavi]|jgi:CDP-diacylglycerol---serine O-phosphatidyltransferase|uniref:CDP-diacylglycerol--serine O-phosphatidyltransferase n=1 Tax=Rossellomorea marisflavi TaxID=189381 RepID=A0A5D4RR18_9BACI|nr:CDP-diacylglycerol--serine O-phosphatidyltransferase [Rossellomorea marisflavi]KQU60210.1 CDP-diacylglycerol--serine O-phosphatidyltransferase [Bacillus sp. Leaf406]MBV6685253.1 CDP-diacylglycerol--serine O-phosphatidyltransferase [Bacillus sp. JRC01]VXB06912.1 CDP-diacylglycerol--serine O-phosphatidyltransferase [Bacillus sp. 349Y]MDR4936999.1 CDP-diacylglycerol--serine O-phosphatidyltransferase [Rossellomorea marisflavi]MDW4526665.1 CDP-diacylglycerol--serine O-phosphatidyltransferase [Ro